MSAMANASMPVPGLSRFRLWRSTRAAVVVIRLAAIYVLLGAAAKLLFATPADLPAVVRSIAPGSLSGLLAVLVAVELFVAVTALISPRIGWLPLLALLIAFLGVLAVQLAEREAGCGCFGELVTIHPAIMLGVDALAAALVMLAMPWSTLATLNWRPWSLAAALTVAVAGQGYLYYDTASPEPSPPADARATAPPSTVEAEADRWETSTSTPPAPGATSDDAPAERSADPTEPADPGWQPPTRYPRYVSLKPDMWVGENIERTVLHTYTDTSRFPDDCQVIFYMETCSHCADHIRSLSSDPPDVPLVFVQVPTINPNQPIRVGELPEGLHVELTSKTKWMIYVPWTVRITDGVVTEAEYLGQ